MGPYLTSGALDLRAYLDEIGQSVPDFCTEHGLERIGIQRMLNGQRRRISLEAAAQIEQATKGVVKMMRWLEVAAVHEPKVKSA